MHLTYVFNYSVIRAMDIETIHCNVRAIVFKLMYLQLLCRSPFHVSLVPLGVLYFKLLPCDNGGPLWHCPYHSTVFSLALVCLCLSAVSSAHCISFSTAFDLAFLASPRLIKFLRKTKRQRRRSPARATLIFVSEGNRETVFQILEHLCFVLMLSSPF